MRLGSYLLSAILVAGATALPAVDLASSASSDSPEDTAYNRLTGVASRSEAPVEARQAVADPPYWVKDIAHQGLSAFNSNPAGYLVFRNVKDFGAVGDGVADDTAAINSAISSFSLSDRTPRRCGPGVCDSSTTSPAVVYFPAGTYKISTPIIDYYYTQIIGNPNSLPVIKATANFQGLGLIDGNLYQSDGSQGWLSTNVFFRQIRNLVLDLTSIPPATAATGIHWATSQATSIQNVAIRMTASSSSQQQGLFIENGSGGWMSDITVTGGLYGFNIGNQQFSMRNINISNAVVGISQIWNWGWTYQGVTISNCGTALDMSGGGSSDQQVGSITILDSTITNCPVFVKSAWTTSSQPPAAGSLLIENVAVNNVPVAVGNTAGGTVFAGPGTGTISSWGQGHKYSLTGASAPGGSPQFQGTFTPVSRPASLLASGTTKYYTKSKPQYEASPTASFLSVRSAGAKGDGSTDDTVAIQNALSSAVQNKKILFFDHGVYKVTNTITIPAGSQIVGETYSVILASGSVFSNINSPAPVVKVGNAGDSGFIEWSDMVVSTQGGTAGAILIQWNLKATAGSGMWDVHTRIGGFQGSNLQTTQCLWTSSLSTSCIAAYMSMHITSSATGVYIENCWFWTADHDLDDVANNSTRISVYTGRGMLVEGSTVWLYGTGVEHHALYQYHFSNTQAIVTSYIQTETPYYMPVPNALTQPFPTNSALNDPNYSTLCTEGNCSALGLRINNSRNIFIYGAGFYSFFNNYSTLCSDEGNGSTCQGQIFQITSSSSLVWVYGLNTVGTLNMVNVDTTSVARFSDNINVYPQTIALVTYRI